MPYNDIFEGVIKHSIQAHAKEELKIRRKCLCDKTGEQKTFSIKFLIVD